MADQKKDVKSETEDDKNINDLLKEYADEVKDKDLDDFLKSDDDAFESDGEDDSDDADQPANEPEQKKSGGVLTGLVLLVAFAAAGAGTYLYLNREDGMTAIMGKINGMASQTSDISMGMPPAPSPEPSMDDQAASMPTPMPMDDPFANLPAPEPVSMEASSATPATSPMADLMPAPEAVPASEPVKVLDTAKTTEDAVNAWVSGMASDLPEKPVEEVKAKPVSAPKAEKKDRLESAGNTVSPRKVRSPSDDALPPPYLAIQGKKAAPAGMAPVVETQGQASQRNINEADQTKATGEYRDMVMNGGGMIEISGSTTTLVPAGQPEQMATTTAAQVQEPMSAPETAMQPRRLAISGGKSLPEGYEDRAPSTPTFVPTPAAVAAPVMSVDTVEPQPEPAQQPQSESAPIASEDAQAMLARAVATEKAGRLADALQMYQRALELDAVYGDGKSIDRGMVYDRIGAIRAATK